jgi:hypothetical protein
MKLEDITKEEIEKQGLHKVGVYSIYYIYAKGDERYLIKRLAGERYTITHHYHIKKARSENEN